MNKRQVLRNLAMIVAAQAVGGAWAQGPGTIKILVGSAPGGQTDQVARLLADALQKKLGQPVIVDNRAGGGGIVAAQTLLTSPPDGNTLLLTTLAHIVNPLLQRTPPYDALKEFGPVASIAQGATLLIVNSSLPVTSLQTLIAYAKANPGKLSYGSAGVGSPQHLLTEYFKAQLGIDMVHVPYKGAAPATLALRTGEIQFLFIDQATGAPLLTEGSARVIAQTGKGTLPRFPNLAKIADVVPNFDSRFWMGIVTQKNVPVAVQQRLSQAITEVVPGFADKLEIAGLQPAPMSRDEFKNLLQSEYDIWSSVIKKQGITSD